MQTYTPAQPKLAAIGIITMVMATFIFVILAHAQGTSPGTGLVTLLQSPFGGPTNNSPPSNGQGYEQPQGPQGFGGGYGGGQQQGPPQGSQQGYGPPQGPQGFGGGPSQGPNGGFGGDPFGGPSGFDGGPNGGPQNFGGDFGPQMGNEFGLDLPEEQTVTFSDFGADGEDNATTAAARQIISEAIFSEIDPEVLGGYAPKCLQGDAAINGIIEDIVGRIANIDDLKDVCSRYEKIVTRAEKAKDICARLPELIKKMAPKDAQLSCPPSEENIISVCLERSKSEIEKETQRQEKNIERECSMLKKNWGNDCERMTQEQKQREEWDKQRRDMDEQQRNQWQNQQNNQQNNQWNNQNNQNWNQGPPCQGPNCGPSGPGPCSGPECGPPPGGDPNAGVTSPPPDPNAGSGSTSGGTTGGEGGSTPDPNAGSGGSPGTGGVTFYQITDPLTVQTQPSTGGQQPPAAYPIGQNPNLGTNGQYPGGIYPAGPVPNTGVGPAQPNGTPNNQGGPSTSPNYGGNYPNGPQGEPSVTPNYGGNYPEGPPQGPNGGYGGGFGGGPQVNYGSQGPGGFGSGGGGPIMGGDPRDYCSNGKFEEAKFDAECKSKVGERFDASDMTDQMEQICSFQAQRQKDQLEEMCDNIEDGQSKCEKNANRMSQFAERQLNNCQKQTTPEKIRDHVEIRVKQICNMESIRNRRKQNTKLKESEELKALSRINEFADGLDPSIADAVEGTATGTLVDAAEVADKTEEKVAQDNGNIVYGIGKFFGLNSGNEKEKAEAFAVQAEKLRNVAKLIQDAAKGAQDGSTQAEAEATAKDLEARANELKEKAEKIRNSGGLFGGGV